MIYRSIRPLLFRLDPETAHSLSLNLLRVVGAAPPLAWALRRLVGATPHGKPVEAFGLRFVNAIGLAAGYDKDAIGWRGLSALGFGHVELGSVTPRRQPGNPRPRVFRLPRQGSLINRLGFPSRGSAFVRERLQRSARPPGLIVGVNLGKQRETPLERAAEDYEQLMDCFAPLADYLAINISSPNTQALRQLQQREYLEPLLLRLHRRRNELSQRLERRVPLLVKLSPDLPDDALDAALEVIVGVGLDGVIATNTTTSRAGLVSPHAAETGGLSGAALTARSTEVVAYIARQTGGRLPIVACGGVMQPSDAQRKLDAGACLVQLYTGLIYGGPGLPAQVLRGLRTGRK